MLPARHCLSYTDNFSKSLGKPCAAAAGAAGSQTDGLPPRRGHGSMGLLSHDHRQFGSGGNLSGSGRHASGSPYMSKLESIASSAVRAADKVMASLIIVYTHSGAQHLSQCLEPQP